METTKTAGVRNQTFECIKLLAALYVVIIHIPFPWPVGGYIGSMGRFAVPVFFAISGYYSYRTEPARLARRMGRIIKLELLGVLVQLVTLLLVYQSTGVRLGIYVNEIRLTLPKIAKWLALNINPYGGHLWYLSALTVCYGILWCYVRFQGKEGPDYKWLYLFSAAMLGTHIALDEFALALGMTVPYELPRNALLFGLPMFTLGLFLRQYGTRIREHFCLDRRKLLVLLALGAALCLVEFGGIGYTEICMGSALMTLVLMLWADAYPTVWSKPGQRWIRRFGGISLWVYILHMAVNDLYMVWLQPLLAQLAGGKEAWLRPILLVLLTLPLAVVFDGIQTWLGKRKM